MKLKKAEPAALEAEAPTSGITIAGRFQLETVTAEEAPKGGASKVMTIIGVVVAFLALAAAGTVVALMHQNWQLIEHV